MEQDQLEHIRKHLFTKECSGIYRFCKRPLVQEKKEVNIIDKIFLKTSKTPFLGPFSGFFRT